MDETLARWSDSIFFYLFSVLLLCNFDYFSRLRPVARGVHFLASHIEVNASQTKNELKFEIFKTCFFHDTIS